jgi:4a-hydroxytetrahydrobiopterin dehydratase
MSDLTERKCKPCTRDAQPLSPDQVEKYLQQIKGWEYDGGAKQISKNYVLKNFQAVLDFVNKIGAAAEKEDHHPNLYIHRYKRLRVELSTHSIGGLSENDFILAAKIDAIEPGL